jgi:hypothetical protein
MSDDFIKKALKDAFASVIEGQLEVRKLQDQVAKAKQRQAKQVLKLISLAALADDIPENTDIGQVLKMVSKMGLTDAVRTVLQANGEQMTSIQIRNQMIKMGVNLDRYKNALGSIHTILGRLYDNGSIEIAHDQKTDKFLYRWKFPETTWDRLGKLPPETTQQLISEVAEEMIEQPIKRTRKSKKASKK